MNTFTRTPEQISEQKQRLIARIEKQIAEKQAELKQLLDEYEGKTPVEQEAQVNRVHNMLRKFEDKVTEVTAYPKQKPKQIEDLLELDETKPIEKNRPTPIKDYSKDSEDYKRKHRNLNNRYIDMLRPKYPDASDVQLQSVLDHEDLGEVLDYTFDKDGKTIYAHLRDGSVRITPKVR